MSISHAGKVFHENDTQIIRINKSSKLYIASFQAILFNLAFIFSPETLFLTMKVQHLDNVHVYFFLSAIHNIILSFE